MKTNALMKFCYDESDGSIPTKSFLLSLDTEMRAKVMSVISLLRDNGYGMCQRFVEEGFADRLNALIIPADDDTTIVIPYFLDEFPDGVVEYALVGGFIRKGEVNPKNVIQKAQRIIDDYLDA